MSSEASTSARLKRAVAALREMRARFEALERQRSSPIAVIGVGCRFPGGVDSADAFWELLEAGTDAVSEVPADRWDRDALYDPDADATGRMDSRWGGFLEDVRGFDPEFFGITPREAVRMDPQQRILLEVAHEALEDAGLQIDRLAGSSTGTFIGAHSQSSDYTLLQLRDPATIDLHTATGTAHSILANRISYWLDLQGPSLTVDTACSSSLVAAHLAVLSLRAGESDLALAGGANLILTPEPSVAFSKMRLFASDGRCKTFDASADGLVRGEGCGVVVLKRLDEAIAAGDRIRAVIAGSAVNQDGRTNGLTAPNGLSQQRVIRKALDDAGVAPDEVTFVETHGTGTFLGDPIEVEALSEVLGLAGSRPCTLGAVKTNLGHLEGAAGIAGLVKAVLAVQRARIPGNLHLRNLNPHVRLDGTRLRLPSGAEDWVEEGPRIAGVSSFGFGGTNGHMVVREPPAVAMSAGDGRPGPRALPVSAASASALKTLAAAYAERLRGTEDLDAVCATAALRRTHREHRFVAVGDSAEELRAALSDPIADGEPGRARAESVVDLEEDRAVAFLYSGQGGQHSEMARDLIADEPVFRAAIERCDETFRDLAGWSLVEELSEGGEDRLDRTSVAQPVLFAMQVGLTELWRHWGITPDAVVGHSVGEIAAAWAAGALSLDDAVRVVHQRGRLIEEMAGPGRMAVLGLARDDVEALEGARSGLFSVAAVNGPGSTVISGEIEAVDAVVAEMDQRDVFVRPLFMAHAFHGPPMEPIRDALVRAVEGISPVASRIPFHSAVVGDVVHGDRLDAAYWGRNLREPVDFPAALRSASDDHTDFLEIGPHPLLTVPARRILGADREDRVLASMRKDEGARRTLLLGLGWLHARGYPVRWSAIYPDPGTPVDLPRHPWTRRELWIDPPSGVRSDRWAPSPPPADPASDTTGGTGVYEIAWQYRPPADAPLDRPARLGTMLGSPLEAPAAVPGPAAGTPGGLPDALDELAACYVARALRALDWPLRIGDRIGDADLAARQLPRHRHRLLLRMLGMLVEDGSLERVEDGWRVTREPDELDPAARLEELVDEHPSHGAMLRLIGRCAPRIASVIRGVDDPLDLLFPMGSSDDLRTLYAESPVSTAANAVVRRAFGRIARDRADGGGLRVLEVGAGTGGTTEHVLSMLEPRGTDYVFTDVSRSFLQEAEAGFANAPGLSTRRLDIESDPGPQGLAQESFDVILASNVVHATEDVRRVLRHLEGLLVPGGALVLVEGTAPSRWVDLTFGLTEGWWRFDDTELRSTHPLLPLETWSRVLALEGLALADSVELPGRASGSGFTQAVMVALKESGAGGADVPSLDGAWLVMDDATGLGAAVVRAVERSGGRVDLLDRDDVEGLRRWLDATQGSARGVVCLPIGVDSATIPVPDEDAEGILAEAAARHQSIVRVVQEIASTQAAAPARLWLVTRGAQATRAGEAPNPIAAVSWGLGRVVALEQPASWGGLVDMDPRADIPEREALALVRHLAASDGEDQVAVRGGDRRVARLVGARDDCRDLELRRDASYVVVGGLGRLGRLFAPWLAAKGAGELVLLGRTPMPARESWDDLPADAPERVKVRAIREAEAAGAEVRVEAIDVTDLDAMEALLRELRDGGRPVRGLIHAASFTEFVPTLGGTREAVESTLRSKVAGSWVLHRLSLELDLELDHFVLFSSVASILGSRAVGAYAGANQFLDALVHARRAQGAVGLVVNWGGWAGGPASESALLSMNHLIPLDPEPTMEALGRLMATGPVQRAVANVDWPALRRAHRLERPRHFLDQVDDRSSGPEPAESEAPAARRSFAERLQAMSDGEGDAALTSYVREAVADVVGLDPATLMESGQGFFKLGMDSLMTVELRGRLQRDLGIELPATIALEYPTVEALSGHLSELLGIASPASAPEADRAGDRGDRTVGEDPEDLDVLDEDELARELDHALADLLEDGEEG